MVVTSSRLHAVRYKQAIDAYLHEKGYADTRALVAFSGTVDSGLVSWAREYLNERLEGRALGPRLLRQALEDHALSAGERDFLAVLRPALEEQAGRGDERVFVGGAAMLLDAVRGSELDACRSLLAVLERRAATLELLRASIEQRLAGRRPLRPGAPLARHGLPTRPDADGLREGDRRGQGSRAGALALRRGRLRGALRAHADSDSLVSRHRRVCFPRVAFTLGFPTEGAEKAPCPPKPTRRPAST